MHVVDGYRAIDHEQRMITLFSCSPRVRLTLESMSARGASAHFIGGLVGIPFWVEVASCAATTEAPYKRLLQEIF
jgi:hypothetical protein